MEGRVSINWIGEECALLTKEVRQRDMSLYRPKPGPEHEYPETLQDTEIASANQKLIKILIRIVIRLDRGVGGIDH